MKKFILLIASILDFAYFDKLESCISHSNTFLLEIKFNKFINYES